MQRWLIVSGIIVSVIRNMLCCVNISFNFLLIVVNDEELKKRIAEELALERARRDSEAQKRRLFGKLLERERISSNEHLTRAILRERAATEEERQKAQRFAKQLEEKDRELKKHDAYYKEQLARLEERVSYFYTTVLKLHVKHEDIY
uniref:Coiled-coil-helix-coiled-coil-helix domain containing 3 n=1 Tax=Buteo japonicus TaxID=224669 RepID=A0A8C0BL45_9AVES